MLQGSKCKINVDEEKFDCYVCFEKSSTFGGRCKIIIICKKELPKRGYEIYIEYMINENDKWTFYNKNVSSGIWKLQQQLALVIDKLITA